MIYLVAEVFPACTFIERKRQLTNTNNSFEASLKTGSKHFWWLHIAFIIDPSLILPLADYVDFVLSAYLQVLLTWEELLAVVTNALVTALLWSGVEFPQTRSRHNNFWHFLCMRTLSTRCVCFLPLPTPISSLTVYIFNSSSLSTPLFCWFLEDDEPIYKQ